ncbi:MAG: hypothetical protein LBT25_04750 [Candidatus Symbiothrix sp.]|nr:hypothetical protein [Candidatus Symbiothrix sp.]
MHKKQHISVFLLPLQGVGGYISRLRLPLQRLGGYILILLVLFACSKQQSRLEQVLEFAGENRPELEKVLRYYEQDPADSLKYRAACFLIENMRYHYCLNNKKLDVFREYLRDIVPTSQTYKLFEKEYGSLGDEKYRATYDAQVITSDYLIRNVDFSFRLWEETPWGKSLSFENFCDELLPYRVGNEPIEDWKEAYYNKYRPMLDTANYDRNSSLAACRVIFSYLHSKTEKDLLEWVYADDLSVPNLGALTLLNLRYGACQEQVDMLCYVMRSVGIPCGIDLMVQHPDNRNSTHWWNYMRDTSGLCAAFDYYYEMREPAGKMSLTRKCGVVYRKCFALQAEAYPVRYHKRKDLFVPSTLSNVFLKNVSEAYYPENPIPFEPNKTIQNGAVLFLMVFNNSDWIPVGWNEVESGKITLNHLEPEVLYLIASYSDETKSYHPESGPFIPHKDGSVFFAKPDADNKQDMALSRKYSLPWWWADYEGAYQTRAIGGKFQAANRPDFSDAVTLYTIPEAAELWFMDVYPGVQGSYGYARYLSGENGYNNMAEVQFFSGDTQLQGEVIGTEGSYQAAPDKTKKSLFDGDILTFFDAIRPSGEWAGLAFDKPQKITHIRYWFRNDDNNVFPGNEYELLYWGEKNWISLGKRVATDTILNYKGVPSKTIYWLRNLTKGKEERPFTYENGEQIFW